MTDRQKQLSFCALRAFLAYLFYQLILRMTAKLLYAHVPNLLGMGTFSAAYLSEDFDLPFNYAYLLNLLVVPFLFYSLVRLFPLSDARGYLTYHEEQTPRLPGVVRSAEYLVWLATTTLCYILFPLDFGMHRLRAWPDFAAVLGGTVEKILFGIILLPLYAFLLALARRSVYREWQSIRAERQSPMRDQLGGLIGFFKDKTGLGGLMLQLLLVLWLYPLGTFAASVLTAILLPFIRAAWQSPATFGVLVAILGGIALLLTLPSYLRALLKRHRLMRDLRKICRRCGYELTVVGHPYLSLLRYGGGADISVKVGDRQYDCKLLGSVLPGGRMLFYYDGKVEIHHTIRLYWAAQARWVVTAHTFEQSTFHTVMDYSFDSEHQKLLIVCPAAPGTYITSAGGGTPIDTGAHIGDYRMFNTTGFLGALERDCLDR